MYAGDADASRPPLFQTLFTHQEVSERNTRIGDLEMSQINLHNGSCPAEISFWLKSSPTVLAGAMEFSTDLFSPERVDRMLNHLMNFFASGASSPDTHVSDVIYIDDSEYSHIHQELNDTAADRANGKDLAALLADTASAHASDTALCYRDTTLTYTELHKQADQIARLLHDEVKADRAVVGICMSRSPMMLASMLACWKAGYAYLPLDADNPTERNGYIVDNAGASVILAEQELHDLSSSWNVPVLCCDSEPVQQRMAALPQDTALPEVDDESLAYVIYTSGSTGVPKGVALPRSSVRNFLLSIANKPGISSSDVVLAITTITFDIHVLELFVPLIVGAKIVLLESEDAADGFRLAETLERFDVSIMQATPSTWHLLDATEWSGKSDLKALVGGEAVPASLVDAIEPKVRELWNMYGPTETTVWSTCCTMKAGQKPLIGTPIDNTQVFILDAAHQPVGVGVPGDLYICGDGLARGYYKDEEKTRGSFFEIDVDGPRRAYRTGDIALVTESGDLEYVSRADDQVKVRGYRIELGEIESALLKVDNIALTAARILNPGTDDARIVGYFVKEQRKSLSQPKIRKVLRHYLPHYMVPQHLVELEEIPLTPNGKVDRKNLPAPGGSSAAEESKQPPRSEQEKQVAAIWSELIGIDNIGRHDNFFTIGGHSLLSMKFIAQLRRQTSANIHVRDVVLGDLAQIARLLPETAKAAEPADAGIMGRYT
jgi:amino acid adenylation domain-containing protein